MLVYRQQVLFAGSGWTPTRSTLLNIIASACFVVALRFEHMKRGAQSEVGVGIDDTSCRMLHLRDEPAPIEGDAKKIFELASCRFIHEHRNLLIIGDFDGRIKPPATRHSDSGSVDRNGSPHCVHQRNDFSTIVRSGIFSARTGTSVS